MAKNIFVFIYFPIIGVVVVVGGGDRDDFKDCLRCQIQGKKNFLRITSFTDASVNR